MVAAAAAAAAAAQTDVNPRAARPRHAPAACPPGLSLLPTSTMMTSLPRSARTSSTHRWMLRKDWRPAASVAWGGTAERSQPQTLHHSSQNHSTTVCPAARPSTPRAAYWVPHAGQHSQFAGRAARTAQLPTQAAAPLTRHVIHHHRHRGVADVAGDYSCGSAPAPPCPCSTAAHGRRPSCSLLHAQLAPGHNGPPHG